MQTQSDQINDIAKALAKAQSEIKPAAKDVDNTFFRSRYADLESVWTACREALTSNGIAVVQGCIIMDGKPYMETKLLHDTGQWLSSFWELLPTKRDSQSLGSAISYMRRYSLASMVGVVQADDDGNAATQNAVESTKAPPQHEQPPQEVVESLAIPLGRGPRAALDWEAKIRKAIDGCNDLDTLTRLQTDNSELLSRYQVKYKPAGEALMRRFVERVGELQQEPI